MDAFRQGQELYLPPVRHYRDYINWLKQQDSSDDETFWRETLSEFRVATPLVVDRVTPVDLDQSRYREQSRRLSLSETLALQGMARQHGLTLNTLVQGAWAAGVEPLCGLDRAADGRISCLASPFQGVHPPVGRREMVGLFINTSAPARAGRPGHAFASPGSKRCRPSRRSCGQYERSPLAEVQRWSDRPRWPAPL